MEAGKEGVGRAVARDVVVPEGGSSREVVLRFGEGGNGTLLSAAFDIEDGHPLPGRACMVYNPSGFRISDAERDDYGIARLDDLPAGSYRAIVTAEGYGEVMHMVEIKDGETVRLQDVLSPAGDFTWGLQDANGHTLAGVACSLRPDDPASIEQPRSGTTGKTGLWILNGILPGRYTATATLPDKPPTSVQVEIRAGVPANVVTVVE